MTAVQEAPEGQVLVTTEIYITDDLDKSVVVGGEPERAGRFAARLARMFDLEAPRPDKVLRLYVTWAEFQAEIVPLIERFPDLRWTWLEKAMEHHPDNQDKLTVSPPVSKPRLSPAEMANKLRDVRPSAQYNFELFREADGKVDARIVAREPDWSWLDDVEREGYDPRGANGPTYWRATPTHYYSVFFQRAIGQLVLLANDHEKNKDLEPEFMPDSQQAIDTAERRHHPWLSLSYQISPAIAADIKTEEDEKEMLKRLQFLLPKGYDFAVAHKLPVDQTIGLVVRDDGNGRDYLIHVMPEEQLVDIDYAPKGMHDQMRASPNFGHIH